MTLEEVYQFFGSSYAACKAIGITRAASTYWKQKGYIPVRTQQKLERITKGKLRVGDEYGKKPTKNDKTPYLPIFRYYDKRYGMCQVDSIYFRQGKMPKIIYRHPENRFKNLMSFNNKNLMQAVDLTDYENNTVYEGDILLLQNGEKFIFNPVDVVKILKKIGNFRIIGNIFE